ncbi:hypothetical protein SNE40_005520 [Patella caerulea]|uniref:Tc1-like transposase DDE domain-containing protein n=1 Tax=Patella caerulea TaxID=87958 RepID=A0AAN8Q031_PATCE
MKKARLEWAIKHKDWSVHQWERVIFSDESTIAVLDDRVQSVRRRRGEEFLPGCLRKTVKFPTKIMVWGAISVKGPSRLYIVEGTMDSIKYVDMLEHRLVPQIKDWYGEDIAQQCIFQQDSAPCHVAKRSKAWFQKNKIKVLDWPGNSPDMSPIETLWDTLKDEIHNVPITNKVDLIARLIKVWFHSEIIKRQCESLIQGMPRRVDALIKAKGRQTKY